MNNLGLSENVLNQILEVLKKYTLKDAKIFGSRAMGNYKKYSDIDIAIFVENGTDDISYSIKYDLEELDIIYFFDVLDYNNISNRDLKNHIDEVGISIIK